MRKSKREDAESKRAQAVRDYRKLKPVRTTRWEVEHRRTREPPTTLATRPATICGLDPMRCRPKATITTTTTAPRMPTTIRARRICRAPIVEPPRRPSGAVTCAGKWFATLAACTSSCMASIAHTPCVVTRFTRADVVQRVTSPIEEVS